MEKIAPPLIFTKIDIDRTNQIIAVWTTTITDLLRALTVKTSDIFTRNTKQRSLRELQKKLTPFVLSDKSEFFLFNNGQAAQSCIVELNLKKSPIDGSPEAINIINMYNNPHTNFQTSEVRRNLTFDCIINIKRFAEIYRFPKITISVNNHTDETIFSGKGFKKYDPKNPDIMTFYTNGFFHPSVIRKHKWNLMR